MVALQGVYEKGTIKLHNQAPVDKADVIVIFPDAETNKESILQDEETRRLFDKYTGSVNRIIDEKKERQEALDEKYKGID